MKAEDLIEKVKPMIDFNWREIKVEINGRTDHEIKEIYVDGTGTICIAINLDEDYVKYLT